MTDASNRRSPIDNDGMAVAGQEPSDRSFNAKSRFDRAGTAAISALIASASVTAVTNSSPSSQVAARSSRIRAATRSAASCSMLVTTAPPRRSDGQHRTASRFISAIMKAMRPTVRWQARAACTGRNVANVNCPVRYARSSRWNGVGIGARVDDRFETRQAYRRLDVRIAPHIDRIVLEMQEAQTIAGRALRSAPIVKGEELEIRHPDRLLDPQGRCNLHGVAERHAARLSFRFAFVA